MAYYSGKKSYATEIPTAAKSHYQEISPARREYDTPSLRSPNRYSSKVHEARQSITDLIGEISGKKSLNEGAIERVKYVNREAMDMLNGGDGYSTYTPKKSYNQGDVRSTDFMYDSSPKYFMEEHQKHPSQFQLAEEYGKEEHVDLESENIELRKALNDQIRVNNELMQRIQHLQIENDDLRRSQKIPAAAFSSPSRNQIPSSILRELEELKRENEYLRRDTVQLLQKQGHY